LNYNKPIHFEWDATKSETCFQERGFDFAYAARAFLDPNVIIEEDTRHSYGEDRYRLMGRIEERLFVLIYTPRRNAVIRIISARKANRREAQHYEYSTRDY